MKDKIKQILKDYKNHQIDLEDAAGKIIAISEDLYDDNFKAMKSALEHIGTSHSESSSAQIARNTLKNIQEPNFELYQKVIWDSNSGYDVGLFLGEGTSYNTYLIDMKSGRVQGHNSLSKHEIFPYSKELLRKMEFTYGYKKDF